MEVNQKGFANIIVIIGLVIFVGIASYLFMSQRVLSPAPIPSHTPTLTPIPTPSPTSTPTPITKPGPISTSTHNPTPTIKVSCDPLPVVSGCTVTAKVINNACVYKYDCSKPTPTPTPSGSIIKVITPNGGELWTKGSLQIIRWSADQSITHISLFLETPPCTPSPGQACAGFEIKVIPIALNLSNTGVFDWTIRYDANGETIPTGKYLVRIEEYPLAPGYHYDYSDGAFDIQ